MGRFIEGVDRTQVMLLPETIDDYVGEDNPVRVEVMLPPSPSVSAIISLTAIALRSTPPRERPFGRSRSRRSD